MKRYRDKNAPSGVFSGSARCSFTKKVLRQSMIAYPANASVARHEVGHNYGCPDQYNDPNPPVCFMNDCYNQFNDICSTCYSTWYGNRYDK